MASSYSIILVTAPDKKTAAKITNALLEERLAACVNRISQVVSRYRWEDEIQETEEILLLIKSRTSLIPEITQCVRENHSYTVPEVVALPITDGSKHYLNWIGANTQFKGFDAQRKVRVSEREL